MTTARFVNHGVVIHVHDGEDGTTVVEIETTMEPDALPPDGLRVWINDHQVQDNAPPLLDPELPSAGELVVDTWGPYDVSPDDEDVPGFVRPHHRHTSNGAEHAHPRGDVRHRHLSIENFGVLREWKEGNE
jgi:hypothetical protein